MLWQVIPQPYCIWEEGVKVGIDRGLGDLKMTCVVSRHHANWWEIIEWDRDDPGAGFMESGYFDPGPALRERDPSRSSHVFSSASRNEGVVSSHQPSCSIFFYLFQVGKMSGLVGVPDAIPVF